MLFFSYNFILSWELLIQYIAIVYVPIPWLSFLSRKVIYYPRNQSLSRILDVLLMIIFNEFTVIARKCRAKEIAI